MRAFVTAAALTLRGGDKQLYMRGEQVDLPKDVLARLVDLGVVSKTRDGGRPAKQTTTAPAPAAQPAPEPDSEPEQPDNDTDDDSDPLAEPDTTDERPARSASIDEWRTYAEANGLATKGLSKQEIIAAIG